MALYLWHSGFTAEYWAEQISDRSLHLDELAAKAATFGGVTQGSWLAFGSYDMIMLFDMPDNATMAAFVLAVTADGHFTAGETTVLLSKDEGLAALEMAGRA